jgi:hypothetical protein
MNTEGLSYSANANESPEVQFQKYFCLLVLLIKNSYLNSIAL